jgi:chaperonin GroES
MKVENLRDRILVVPDPPETETESGLIIPVNAQERPSRGKIAQVGEGLADEKMELRVGDTAVYGKHVGVPVVIDAQLFLIMRQADVLFTIPLSNET